MTEGEERIVKPVRSRWVIRQRSLYWNGISGEDFGANRSVEIEFRRSISFLLLDSTQGFAESSLGSFRNGIFSKVFRIFLDLLSFGYSI